ncbi:uncharacterized protein METZ01_LOCUS351759 [marine metagenome]|uniref:Uncharacterized protein n=1 Tax=marine metagenome TaxID=408172 RepID=A0A382RP16_9ZZZZ
MVESFVSAFDHAPFFTHHPVGFFYDFIGERQGVTWTNRLMPDQVFYTDASTISSTILYTLCKSFHVIHHQAHPDGINVPTRGDNATVYRVPGSNGIGMMNFRRVFLAEFNNF